MFHKSVCTVVLLSLLGVLWTSCEGIVEPSKKRTAEDVNVGEVHNIFAGEFLKRYPRRHSLSRKEKIQAYLETARAVCEDQSYDFEPTEGMLNEFLAKSGEWQKAGIWDIYNPTAISPNEALDRFVAAGIIPAEHAAYLHRLLEGLQRSSVEPGGPLLCAAAPCAEIEFAGILLQSSCDLWYDECGPVPIQITDPGLAEWWKTALKYLGTGACDGLAGCAAWFAFGGNPFAVGFFGGVASVAAHDAFNERGW